MAAWAPRRSHGATSEARRSSLCSRCVWPPRYQDAVHEQHLQSQLADAKQKLALDQAGCGPRPTTPAPVAAPAPVLTPAPTLTSPLLRLSIILAQTLTSRPRLRPPPPPPPPPP